ncbi:cardiolipin synthase [Sporobolomyces salmoneus]|uniref:cardiolipin synthase n=1 Tax=Sporobolomyces salmoneus TaxID=183962 RepID=UPI00317DB4F9
MSSSLRAATLLSRTVTSRQTFPSFFSTSSAARLPSLLSRSSTLAATRTPLRISTLIQPRRFYSTPPPTPSSSSSEPPSSSPSPTLTKHENIYTIPNALTLARILSCPLIGWYIVKGELGIATSLLFVAGVSDLVDGYLARKYNMGTVLGSIMDPAADKLLMTTMVISLTMRGMLPMPLAVLILGRDVLLILSAFYFRYASLPPPKTFKRYWDFSIPSASVHPTTISKYNTFLQLVLVGTTTVGPLLPFDIAMPLTALQWIVAGTTVWSGLSYVGSGKAIKYLK